MRDQEDHLEGEATLDGERPHLRLHAFPSDEGISLFVENVTRALTREAELETLCEDLEFSKRQFRTLCRMLQRPQGPFR